MADIAFSDVTITVTKERRVGGATTRREVEAAISFGNNTLTYPTGGVPITGKQHLGVTEAVRACRSLGFPTELDDLVIIDENATGAAGSGFVYKWDRTNNKIKVYVNTAGGANDELGEHTNATFVPNPCVLRVIGSGT